MNKRVTPGAELEVSVATELLSRSIGWADNRASGRPFGPRTLSQRLDSSRPGSPARLIDRLPRLEHPALALDPQVPPCHP